MFAAEGSSMVIIWPILWILFMLGLVVTTIVVAIRENKARALAAKQMMSTQPGISMTDDGAAEGQSGDQFGGSVDFAEFDESSFK